MKLAQKLCGVALLAAMGVAVAQPSITKAEETHSKKGDVDVQFTRNREEDEDTGRPIFTDSEGNSRTDVEESLTRPIEAVVFGVQDVSPISFGERKMVNDGNDREYWAKNYTEETGGKAANYVIIKDTRNTLNHHYTLTASITTPLYTMVDEGGESTKRELSGATLTYRNIGIRSTVADNLALPEEAVAEGRSVTVEAGKESTFISNKGENLDAGQGQTQINFGTLTEEGEKSSTESVKLTVGKDQTIFEGNYRGEVTWVMSEVK